MNSVDIDHPALKPLIGQTEKMLQIKKLMLQVAACDANVLITGQSGTGKDVIASCIHNLSHRHTQPLVPINCGAIPSELMESELFGHEKGAFTGALSKRPGRFETAHQGTLFLDEIGDMPLVMQVKLLRVIQEKKVTRLGSHISQEVDVRIISATNQHLEELISLNRFREDLFYRLNVFPIHVPNLCDRKDDIPLLIEFHLKKIASRLNRQIDFSSNAMNCLINYNWPGNIRELANFLERMAIIHNGYTLDVKDLDILYTKSISIKETTPIIMPNEWPFNIKEYIGNIEKQMIKIALEKSNGIISTAADYLSLGRTTLIEKMKKYNLAAKF